MKIIVFVLLFLMAFPAVADQESDLAWCQHLAQMYLATARDRDNGWSMTASISAMQQYLASPEYQRLSETDKLQASQIYHAAIRDVYDLPTVQAQVFFGFALGWCEAIPPQSPKVIIPAPAPGDKS